MYYDELKEYLLQQVYIVANGEAYSGILKDVTPKVTVVRTVYPGYGDITDYMIRIDDIAYVRFSQ